MMMSGSAVVSTSLQSPALQSGQGTSLQGSLRTRCCSMHSRSTSLRPRLFIQYACRVRTPCPQLFEHCNHTHIALQYSTQSLSTSTLHLNPRHDFYSSVYTEGIVFIIHTNFNIALYLFASIDFNYNAYH